VARGALLLEVLLALGLFVAAGMVVLSTVAQSVRSLQVAREKETAADLARSAMAKLEAGIETATTLNGPVPVWRDEGDTAHVDAGPVVDSGWELEVETAPSEFEGLTIAVVTARRTRPLLGSEGASPVSCTLRQLVRLSDRAEDKAGERDDISVEAERGAAELPEEPSVAAPPEERGSPREPARRGGSR
jgi:type II secretory pathway pseudopilin PulG